MQPRSRIFTYITAIAVFAALTVPGRLAAQATQKNKQPPKYYVFNLGQPLGGIPEPVAINNLGWISGTANLATNTSEHAVLWTGVPLDLGTLGGPNSAVEFPNHSNKGEIIGIAETADIDLLGETWSCAPFFFGPDGYVCRGFAWQNGVMTELPTLGGINGYATSVNNNGQITGWAETTYHDPTCVTPQVLQFEAVIWGPNVNEMTELPPLSGDPDSTANAINDKGQVVGISGLCSNAYGGASALHSVIWENGQPAYMGNIGGAAWNTPIAINNNGVVVGLANTSGDQNQPLNPAAWIWTKATGMKEIYPIGADTNDVAFDINNNNQVIGQSLGAVDRAFLYQNGQIYDLNALVVQPTTLYLTLAQGINDAGEISGSAIDTSTNLTVGFLAVPVSNGSGTPPSNAPEWKDLSKLVSPENIRQQLQRQPGLAGVVARAMATK